jgi:hypothetical protein
MISPIQEYRKGLLRGLTASKNLRSSDPHCSGPVRQNIFCQLFFDLIFKSAPHRVCVGTQQESRLNTDGSVMDQLGFDQTRIRKTRNKKIATARKISNHSINKSLRFLFSRNFIFTMRFLSGWKHSLQISL